MYQLSHLVIPGEQDVRRYVADPVAGGAGDYENVTSGQVSNPDFEL
ncbi:hypothetical protein Z945_1629 [Sulfitobacter noctilucae]|nr:hypothetical protein Z945_1629 [Sulfitobacter noctilucae]